MLPTKLCSKLDTLEHEHTHEDNYGQDTFHYSNTTRLFSGGLFTLKNLL